jgi:hypothetical protein
VTEPSPPSTPSAPGQGTTKIERLSLGTGTTAAMSLRTLDHGTAMWMPLAGRIVCGWVPSSSARTSSAHTPVALTTTRALASISTPPPASTRTPVIRPPDLVSPVTPAWLTTVAPWSSAAVRAMVSVSLASSVWAS